MRAIVTVLLFAWGWGLFFCLPLALQLFPTGSTLGPRWRALGWLTLATAVIGTTSTGPTPEFGASSYLVSPWWEQGEAVAGLLAPIVVCLSLAPLLVRYERGDQMVRQQLQWLLVAVVVALVLNVSSWFSLPSGREILLLLSFALIPAAVTIAVLRYQLFDVRLVLSRVLVYAILTGIVVLTYFAIVAVLNLFLTAVGAPLLAALAVALGFNPLRLRVQRKVERALYGARRDPIGAVSAVGRHLASDDLNTMLDALRESLRLPYASLVGPDGQRLTSGHPEGEVTNLPLLHAGEPQGSLEIGVRRGERQLSQPDLAILDLLCGPLAVALHATRLTRQLQASRDHVLNAAAEERSRLHRELHDSLGPILTGAALKADGTALAARTEPQKAEQLATQLADQLREAIHDVRQLGLRAATTGPRSARADRRVASARRRARSGRPNRGCTRQAPCALAYRRGRGLPDRQRGADQRGAPLDSPVRSDLAGGGQPLPQPDCHRRRKPGRRLASWCRPALDAGSRCRGRGLLRRRAYASRRSRDRRTAARGRAMIRVMVADDHPSYGTACGHSSSSCRIWSSLPRRPLAPKRCARR